MTMDDSLESWANQVNGRLRITLQGEHERILDVGLTELGMRARMGHESILTWEWSSIDEEGHVLTGRANLRVLDVTNQE